MQGMVSQKISKGKQNKMVQSSIIIRCPSFSHSMSCSGQAFTKTFEYRRPEEDML